MVKLWVKRRASEGKIAASACSAPITTLGTTVPCTEGTKPRVIPRSVGSAALGGAGLWYETAWCFSVGRVGILFDRGTRLVRAINRRARSTAALPTSHGTWPWRRLPRHRICAYARRARASGVRARIPRVQETPSPRRAHGVPGTRAVDKKKNVCLINALRSLGVPVPYAADGPFWALRDGNRMLEPFAPLGYLPSLLCRLTQGYSSAVSRKEHISQAENISFTNRLTSRASRSGTTANASPGPRADAISVAPRHGSRAF